MRYRGGGVGHLTTRQCNEVLFADKHTPFDENTNIPSLVPPDQASRTEDEGDEGEGDKDRNDEQLAAAIHDTDIITMAGFGAL